MYRKTKTLIHLLVLSSMLLGACQSEVTSQIEAGEKDLDAAYTTFLHDMVLYNTISLDDLNRIIAEEPPPFLLDVREFDEVLETGYIEGAVIIPIRDLGSRTDLLPSFDTTIVTYCTSGWRCTIAMTALEVLGWENVLSLSGGSFSGWLNADQPIATGLPETVPLNAATPDPGMLALMADTLSNIPEEMGMITVHDVNNEMMTNPDLILLDVRQTQEVQNTGAIEGALHIPLEEFIARKDDWPSDKDAKIVVYSGYGFPSIIAMTILWSYGYSDVWSLIG
jgi:rhodanese-related sulfurtransferase